MIPFQKTLPIDLQKFNKYLSLSIDAGVYSNNGPNVKALTKQLEEATDSKVVLTSNATVALDGLHHLMQVWGAKKASLPSFTFPATNQGCRVQTIHPTTNPNTLLAEHKQGSADYYVTTIPFGCRTSALSINKKPAPNAVHIVDNAAGYDVELESVRHCLKYADAVVVSFHATKPLSGGEGGVIFFTNNRLYDQYKKYSNFGFYFQTDGSRTTDGLGSNHKMSELSAACIRHYLGRLDELILDQSKRLRASLHIASVIPKNVKHLIGSTCIWMDAGVDAHEAASFFKNLGVEAKPYYSPFFGSYQTDSVGYLASKKGLCVPNHATGADLKKIINAVEKFYARYR